MLGWLKKKTDAPEPQAPPPVGATPVGSSAPKDTPEALAMWQARLDAAAGDDATLLVVARQAPSVAIQCGAIAALTDEAALKQAERDSRTHDRRVHRAAKQRHDAAVAQRVARERASGLIDMATALQAEPTIPTNRLVELDKSWQALDPHLLSEAQKAQFAELSARLTELTRERGEQDLQAQRWMDNAKQALVQLSAALALAASGSGEPDELAALARATATAQACAENPPDSRSAAALHARLLQALQEAEQVSLKVASAAASQAAAQAAMKDAADVEARANLLHAQQPTAPHQTPEPTARKAAQQLARRERAEAVAPLLQHAEAALENGNLAETHRHLLGIDSALAGGAAPEALRARLNTLHAEYARLKGWQSWGGGRARDDLVQEAQTLATATAAALADPLQAAKLPVKQLADVIDDLRKRWKELDRLGGATNQTLWHAFDAALKAAFEPVGAHLDQLKARRKENLAARLQLITALEAARPDDRTTGRIRKAAAGQEQASPARALAPAEAPAERPAERPAETAAEVPAVVPSDAPGHTPAAASDVHIDWKEQARALAHFQMEWRKLGPVEHTVPHKARDALLARMQASITRIEAPLQQARHDAQQVREQLVARAKAMSDEAAASPHGRDLVGRVRELQEQWQQHARTLPLTRHVENALWAEFKAATDAVFVQRDAAFSARDAELLANQVAREALIARLEGLTAQTPAPEFKRTLAEVDSEWQQGVDVPRHQVAPLDARFRAARQAAQHLLAGSAQRLRHARFDALLERLVLCELLEGLVIAADPAPSVTTTIDELGVRWAAATALQPAWEQALASRWQQVGGKAEIASAVHAGSALDSVLLKLEAALNLASPADVQAARRDMKLRAMKAALEGRSANQAPPPSVEVLTQAALRHAHPSAPQRERLHAIIAALRTQETSPP